MTVCAGMVSCAKEKAGRRERAIRLERANFNIVKESRNERGMR